MTVTRIALGVLRSPAGVVWIERAKPPSLGRWALPGGRIEPGEEPLEAARREVLEETELVVTGGLHLAVLEEHFEDAAGRHLYTVEVHAVLFDDPGDAPVAADGVSEDELKRIKAQLIAGQVFERDSIYFQAMQIGSMEIGGYPHRSIEVMLKKLQAVTAAEVQAVAKKFLIDDSLTIAVLDPQPVEGRKPAPAIKGLRHGQ